MTVGLGSKLVGWTGVVVTAAVGKTAGVMGFLVELLCFWPGDEGDDVLGVYCAFSNCYC